MLLTPVIITLLLSASSFCLSMNESSITGLTKKEEKKQKSALESNFYKIWGYGIPDTLIKTNVNGKTRYTVVHKSYVKKHPEAILEIIKQDEDNSDIVAKMEELKAMQEIKNSNTPVSTPIIDPLEEMIRKFELQEKMMQEEIAQNKAKLEQNLIKNEAIKKELEAQELQNIAKEKKPNNTNNITKSIQKELPKENPNKNYAAQEKQILHYLYKKYGEKYGITIKSKDLLKEKLALYSKGNDNCCIGERINDYCTWSYCHDFDRLIIKTNNPKRSDSSEESDSFDISCD